MHGDLKEYWVAQQIKDWTQNGPEMTWKICWIDRKKRPKDDWGGEHRNCQ